MFPPSDTLASKCSAFVQLFFSSSEADGEREDSTFRKPEPALSEATELRVMLGFQ